MHAAAVNPTDAMLRTGAYAARTTDVPPPYVPGMDAAGVIDQLGPGADGRLAVGQRVVALVIPTGPRGAYAEHIVVPAESVVPAPAGTGHAEASTLLMNAATARLALDTLALPKGATVAVTGAAGAVGGYAIELAKADGLTVVADAAPHDRDLVHGFGADHVVDRGTDVAARIRESAPAGVPGLVDGSDSARGGCPRGRGRRRPCRAARLAGPAERGVTVTPVFVASVRADTVLLDTLRRQAEEGVLSLRVAKVLPASDAAEAHRLLEAGRSARAPGPRLLLRPFRSGPAGLRGPDPSRSAMTENERPRRRS